MSGRLDEIRARWAEVTPWPWSQDPNNAKKLRGVDGDTFAWVLPDGDPEAPWNGQNQRDMDALANAPADVAWLVEQAAALTARAERAEAEGRRLEAENDRLRRERSDALNVQTREGLGASEWVLRTGKAERERDDALARVKELEAEVQRLHEVSDHQRRERDEAQARLRELAGMLVGDAACIDSGGEELDYARFERLCREALDDPSASGRDVGVLGLLGMRERSARVSFTEVCRDLGCTNTATHGPDGEPFVCWEHSGNFPRCR